MKVLVVDDDDTLLDTIRSQLEHPGVTHAITNDPILVTCAESLVKAREELKKTNFDYVILDLVLTDSKRGGLILLQEVVSNYPGTIPIMMSSNRADENLEFALKNGAAEYIIKPFSADVIHDIMRKARVVHRLWVSNKYNRNSGPSFSPISLTSKNAAFNAELEKLAALKGKPEISVLITGESGVGKEVLAKHLWSIEQDASRPFVDVHAGAIPDTLFESELFGHVKGAFSGATSDKPGKLLIASGGDIFLDEIATMPMEAQAKLLRALQEKAITPVGSKDAKNIKVDVRVISATNADLEQMIKDGEFREDLFYRLNMLTVHIPPLRKRREDIADLITYFLNLIPRSNGLELSSEAMDFCLNYEWPGNIRELHSTVTVASALCESKTISLEEIKARLNRRASIKDAPLQRTSEISLSVEDIKGMFEARSEKFEMNMALLVLQKFNNPTDAAKYLGIHRSTLISKMDRWGVYEPYRKKKKS
jgi:DNA-binding NtrC family response regulator